MLYLPNDPPKLGKKKHFIQRKIWMKSSIKNEPFQSGFKRHYFYNTNY
ncbi:hypothetical protein QW060_13505 [Myroides ceti]|uniref:Uncharacterized protein n=1 Tax=Paenimyroides ceti TaxID=395087 RepID=A0ABT8CUD2_9FLAO|nr:hypothetical protein [Paenimyroides ceti]MDN3708122.1 hypothetical protein [Paenimyroides ceti]